MIDELLAAAELVALDAPRARLRPWSRRVHRTRDSRPGSCRDSRTRRICVSRRCRVWPPSRIESRRRTAAKYWSVMMRGWARSMSVRTGVVRIASRQWVARAYGARRGAGRGSARPAHAAGNGLAAHPDLRLALERRGLQIHDNLFPRADAIAALAVREFAAGRTVAAAEVAPVYVRDQVVQARHAQPPVI